MTTKLEAINTMLSCVGQSPLKTLVGTKSFYTITAEQILDDELKRALLTGWDFNTDVNYELKPDSNKHINITEDMLLVKIPQIYRNQFVERSSKLYDKINHTYDIDDTIKATIIWNLDFENTPENFRHYVKISAAYKFCKRVLGSQNACMYTKEDVMEAYADLQEYELETGNYTIIPEMRNGRIRGSI